MFFNKKEKVIGKIVRFLERDNKHYPVFSFMTKDGKIIEQEIINDTPLEDVIKDKWLLDFLEKPLPITDVEIVYKKLIQLIFMQDIYRMRNRLTLRWQGT